MPEIWLIIVAVILALIFYSIISSKLKTRRTRKLREQSVPIVDDNVQPGTPYNVHLSDGKKYLNVQLVGTTSIDSGQFSISWEGMLILRQTNGKRIFIRQHAVRCIEEI